MNTLNSTACCQATQQGKPLWYLFCLRDKPLYPTTLHTCSVDNDGFGSEAGSEEGSQRSETVELSPSSYRAPTRKKREYRQTQPFQTYIQGESHSCVPLSIPNFSPLSIPILSPFLFPFMSPFHPLCKNVVSVLCAKHCIHEMCP